MKTFLIGIRGYFENLGSFRTEVEVTCSIQSEDLRIENLGKRLPIEGTSAALPSLFQMYGNQGTCQPRQSLKEWNGVVF